MTNFSAFGGPALMFERTGAYFRTRPVMGYTSFSPVVQR
jgi:hypothetical protein